MKLQNSHRIFITVIALALGIGILVCVVAIPSLNGIIKLSSIIEDERNKIEKTLQRAMKLSQTTKDVEDIQSALPPMEKMLVAEGNEITLFTFLEERIKEHGLTETLRLGELTNSRELPLSIDLKGPFANVLKFISAIEKSQLFMPFNALSMRLLPSEKGSFELTTSLKAKTYVTEKK